MPAQYLIVDGHSVIFAWPELRELHERLTSLARDVLVHVVVVFDGRGSDVGAIAEPGEVQIFYSRTGQTADSIVERLASKYGSQFKLLVATSDYLEQETVGACGAECISAEGLRALLDEVRTR